MTVAGQTREGGTVTYTLTITNVGAGRIRTTRATRFPISFPAGLTLLAASAGSGAR